MQGVSIDRFTEYFLALHGREPYSWQKRLASMAVDGNWPAAVDLPTGSGKTACIDIAVFALACQVDRPLQERGAPRRIFFCVNRRVIVDEAYQRSIRIARKLWEAEDDASAETVVLRQVAHALRRLAGTAKADEVPPLDALELRGGIYRDNRWARSATQPTVICTTIDQLGSRLLFRGYGVSSNAAPIQAALIAYDSLVLLDEAHISQPFQESLKQVSYYLDWPKWAEEAVGALPMKFVPMTATPPAVGDANSVIRLDEADRANKSLMDRLAARKPAQLRIVADVAKAIIEEAGRYAEASKAVGIIVNRIATAREIYKSLRTKYAQGAVELVIGSMRPIDRDAQAERFAPLIGPNRGAAEATSFTIATQCLEVGADFDFDVLLTECASLDALRQRFGRLNRGGRPIEAHGAIFVKNKDAKPEGALVAEKPLDPIYGNALASTWNWLSSHAQAGNPEGGAGGAASAPASRKKGKSKTEATTTESRFIDFGIDALDELLKSEGGRIPSRLLAPSAQLHAPVMLPAYVDFWCQTSPHPVPDPDVALFIHGEQRSESDVQVCWRADLVEQQEEIWPDIVALVPPTSRECMSVPIARVRDWLSSVPATVPNDCDLLEVNDEAPGSDLRNGGRNGDEHDLARVCVLWRGAGNSVLLKSSEELRPGDTVVFSVSAEGWDELGHIPKTPRGAGIGADQPGNYVPLELRSIDVAEEAFQASKDRVVLRLHSTTRNAFPPGDAIDLLFFRATDSDDPPTLKELGDLLRDASSSLGPDHEPLRRRLHLLLKSGLRNERYPDSTGLVVTGRERAGAAKGWFLPSLDDGDDESSRVGVESPVTLDDHTDHVRQVIERTATLIAANVSAAVLDLAAKFHDWGKADERFQAILQRASLTDAYLLTCGTSRLLAKSSDVPATPGERRQARELAGLPDGFRHEMLSVQLAERSSELASNTSDRNLILHLIASHHGYARPFAPVVLDGDPPRVGINGVELLASERVERPAHRLDSGIAERFWLLTRRFGWWGLAYLEALLRIADQQASADEDSTKSDGKSLV